MQFFIFYLIYLNRYQYLNFFIEFIMINFDIIINYISEISTISLRVFIISIQSITGPRKIIVMLPKLEWFYLNLLHNFIEKFYFY